MVQKIHSPRLDTVAMVEETIKKSKENLSKTELWKKLPKQMMYQTFSTAIDYLVELKKIRLNEEGKIEWIAEQHKAKEIMKEGKKGTKAEESKKKETVMKPAEQEEEKIIKSGKIKADEKTIKTASELSEIERKALKALAEEKKELSVSELSEKAGIELDSARRSIQWLNEKGLGRARIQKEVFVSLGEEGLKALKTGLPEKNFLKELGENWKKISEIKSIPKNEINIALGNAKKKGLIELKKENELMMKATAEGKNFLEKKTEEELMLEKISGKELNESSFSEKEKEVLKFLGFRKNFLKHREKGNEFIEITAKGIECIPVLGAERKYNILDPVEEVFPGKKQPYYKFQEEIKQKLVSLGFKEMENPLIVQEFYNFDVLFQPQNHPARTWTDTYKLKKPEYGKLPDKKIVQAIKAAHENGGKAESKGWKYEWNEKIASQLMPSAHGTAHSARQLVKGIEVPGKYFTTARCFRPDVVDATHLIEFNQMEGFVVGKEFNFRKLLGLLKEFAIEIAGAEKVKFLPDYYPFTEPSVQLNALHPELGWVEFGGAGIFRAEITENLGIKEKCLAWGLGMDRLAMFKLKLNDVRELFSQNLNWLRKGI
ncbi:MAG: phenylalanine--tRNA ligase subunit alpha [archaeon]